MTQLPSVFISHGSPMHALEPGALGASWRALAQSLPRPKAILVASAHWEAGLPTLTGAEHPETVHDFYGFPEPLYRLRYPAPGSQALAARVRELLKQQGDCSGIDGTRGLDHGAWSQLLHMYPAADIPVVQLSIQTGLGAAHHIDLGHKLAPLRDEGILVMGSGNLTHNLREAFGAMRGGAPSTPLPYVREFQQWVKSAIESGNTEALADYRRQAPHAARAHPSDEHFLPLHVAYGAALGPKGEPPARTEQTYDDIELASLAMDTWVFH
jgi:4,5-DOPA dioxygenase extradiol